MQSEFLAVSPESDQFESTLNKLEWTESQRNGFKEYIYTSGQQHDVCVASSNEIIFVSKLQNTHCKFALVFLIQGQQCLPEACCRYQDDVCSASNGTACCDRNCPAMRSPPLCAAAYLTSPQTLMLAILFILDLLITAL